MKPTITQMLQYIFSGECNWKMKDSTDCFYTNIASKNCDFLMTVKRDCDM
jgi:hypothetical protein